MVEAAASVVSFTLLIAESIDAFTPERQASIRVTLSAELACFAPACLIKIVLTAGSVNLEVVVTIPNEQDGGDSVTPAVLVSTSNLLALQGAGSLASVFGSTAVASSTSPNVQRDVTVLVAVTRMPSPPPSPPPPSPPLSPKSDFPVGAVVGPVVGVAVCIGIAVGIFICCRRRKSSAKARRGSQGGEGTEEENKPSPIEESASGITVRV